MEFDPITGEPLEPRVKSGGRRPGARGWALIATAVAGCAVVGVLLFRAGISDGSDSRSTADELLVEPGVRIRVEVLNATQTPRLARHATRMLRDRGFDVVAIGNASEQLDSTAILDRSGHPEWAELAATAMDGARVESRPDSSSYLDLTVLVGASWTPPPQALYP